MDNKYQSSPEKLDEIHKGMINILQGGKIE
jgi:hypothetical protein